MKKSLNPAWLIIPSVIAIWLFFGHQAAWAQQPPTLLPSEDVDIGGRGGACIGLATMIKTGNISLRSLPCFVKYFTQTLVSIAGSLAVIFVMIGGYRLVIGPDEDKETAKKTITYALIGLVVSMLAWVIIDLALQVATE